MIMKILKFLIILNIYQNKTHIENKNQMFNILIKTHIENKNPIVT